MARLLRIISMGAWLCSGCNDAILKGTSSPSGEGGRSAIDANAAGANGATSASHATDEASAEQKRRASLSTGKNLATLEAEAMVARLPGKIVKRVGVNFEDRTWGSDRDYNDAVLCFKGSFKVDQTSVVSLKKQTVQASTSSRSLCRHKVTAKIVHPDGSEADETTYDSKQVGDLPLAFEIGDRLVVTMVTTAGGCGGDVKSMDSPESCRVLLDVCNTQGR